MALSQEDAVAAKGVPWALSGGPEGGPSPGWGGAPFGPQDTIDHPVKRLCLRESSSSPRPTPGAQGHDPEWALGSADASTDASTLAQQGEGGGEEAAEVVAEGGPAEEGPCAGSSGSSLDCLGEDLLLHVLRLAQPTAWDLCRMACVSRTWRDACYSRVFWSKLRVGPGSMRAGVEQLASRCGGLVELHIDDPRCELYVLHPIVVACGPSLRRVAITCDADAGGAGAGDASSRNEAAICSILWIISLHCKNVETLELLSQGRQGGFQYLEAKALWYLTTGFRNIRSFASLCQESITRQSLYLMVIAWRDLTCLRIHCALLGLGDLVSLRKCHALRVLELVGGSLKTMVGELVTDKREMREVAEGRRLSDVVIHTRLEIVVLTDVPCEPQDLVCLAQQCPGLRRVLLSRSSWAGGDEPPHGVARQHSQFKLLQTWLQVAKGVELLMED